jgi:hypothetical protein
MSSEIHNWSTGTEDPTTFGPFDLAEGTYTLASDMPATVERQASFVPPVMRTVIGEQYGAEYRRQEIEVEPASSTWEPVDADAERRFIVPEPGTYRVVTAPGKGRISLSTPTNEDIT